MWCCLGVAIAMVWRLWIVVVVGLAVLAWSVWDTGWQGLIALGIFSLLTAPLLLLPTVWQWKLFACEASLLLLMDWHMRHNELIYDRIKRDRQLWRCGSLQITLNSWNISQRQRE